MVALTKGETLRLAVSASGEASLEFRLGGAETQTVVAALVDSEWVAVSETDDWTPGHYQWQAWATLPGGEKSIISRGEITLEDSLAVGDLRTIARKNVDAIEKMLLGNAAEGILRYKINNRELERYSIVALMRLLTYWKAQLRQESRKETGSSALGPRITIRF